MLTLQSRGGDRRRLEKAQSEPIRSSDANFTFSMYITIGLLRSQYESTLLSGISVPRQNSDSPDCKVCLYMRRMQRSMR
jgi:hypothetical protein